MAAVAALLAVLTACSMPVAGTPHARSGPVPTAGPADPAALSAATVAALQDFWRLQFPATFGKPWTDLATAQGVHPTDPGAARPPCVDTLSQVGDQAFYCSSADAVIWDADGLIPDLDRKFGPAGVIVVLAHEVGHAVEARLGVQAAQRADPTRYPTILLEAMADCYAGVALAHFETAPFGGIPLGPAERDDALLAMVGFRDPLGVQAADRGAHGNAFDRVSAFQDGYTRGPALCAAMTVDNRAFTERRFSSAADAARKGDLPMSELLPAVELDARRWFGEVGRTAAPGWQPPPLGQTTASTCPSTQLTPQGPVRFCAADGRISVDRAALAPVHRDLGDYADGTLIVSRYGLALRTAGGGDPTGPAAGAAAVCLAGAYTGRLLTAPAGFSLSPGDLDEAVQVLLKEDWAARDAGGAGVGGVTGFERVAHFRAGFTGGPPACAG